MPTPDTVNRQVSRSVVREVEDVSLWSIVSGSSSLNAKDVAAPTSQNKKINFQMVHPV